MLVNWALSHALVSASGGRKNTVLLLKASLSIVKFLGSTTLQKTASRLLHFLKADKSIDCRLSGSVTYFRLVQPKKALIPMLVTPSGISMAVRLLQLLKQLPAIDVNFLLKIVHFSRPAHSQKASRSMVVTLAGIVTDFRTLQPLKARSPMVVTLAGIETDSRL